jgi:hypothetical protein
MRYALVGALFICLPFSWGACAAPSGGAVQPVMLPSTPSGEGDPNTIVCRAPQPIAGTDQFGPTACGHNYEWFKLAMNGKDLAPDGKTLIDKPTVANPKGEGDPDAVICRTPKVVSRPQDWVKRFAPTVCRSNRFWADVIKNHQIVTADGSLETLPRRNYQSGFSGADYGGSNWPGIFTDSGSRYVPGEGVQPYPATTP